MERRQDLVNKNGVHRSIRDVNQAVSELLLLLSDFLLCKDTSSIPLLQLLWALDAIKDNWLKPFGLEVEPELDEVVLELDVDAFNFVFLEL